MARAAVLLPATGAAGTVLVDVSMPDPLEVVEVADGVLQAAAARPTATMPRAANSLRTLRGYPRGLAGALAPMAG